MTMTDTPTPVPPPTQRVLRRRRDGRVASGVAAGLGDYFALDPVLFRVLFATSAFFGGAGILAYLLAWAAIPEEGTETAPIDGWVRGLRRRRVPLWLLVGGSALLLWLVAFSWWAPGPFGAVVVVVVLLVVAFGRREMQATPPAAPVSLDKPYVDPATPGWVSDTRQWIDEARAAGRARRRRSLPVRLAVLGALVVTLTILGIVDGVSGVALQAYFWSLLGIVGLGLLVGVALRRTPWATVPLLVPAVVGVIAFAGSHASLHDGVGQREWRPATATGHYRLAFGQGILDLRHLEAGYGSGTISVTMGAGRLRVIAPKTLDVTVQANIHIGDLDVNGVSGTHRDGYAGVGLSRTVDPPSGATGTPITVNVHLADGNVSVEQP